MTTTQITTLSGQQIGYLAMNQIAASSSSLVDRMQNMRAG